MIIKRPRILLVILLCGLSSCAGMQQMQDPELWKAESLEQEEKFKEAADAYEKLADQYLGTSRGEEALFSAGRVRSRHDNPQKEYQRALQDFDEFIKTYPNSDRAGDAQTWRSLIRTILELKKENERLSKSIEELKRVDIQHEERRRK
jgi:outer membrane protein assembly factor BamD (BamD/ComL family)